MANDFEYSQRGHEEAAKALDKLSLNDDERAFSLEQAALILQPAAMQYKMDRLAGEELRPIVVRAAILRALIYVKNEIRAMQEGRNRYDYAAEASVEADRMMADRSLTPDESRFVRELSDEASRSVERELIMRAHRGQTPIRAEAMAGALVAAIAHADDWEKYGWLKQA